MRRRIAAISIVLAFVLLPGVCPVLGEEPFGIPDRDYTLWGTAYVDGVALTDGDAEYIVSLKVNDEELASYTMGSEPLAGDRYILRVPMSVGGRYSGRAQTGDAAYIYINGVIATEAYLEPGHQSIALPVIIGNPAETVEISIYTQIPPGAIDNLAASTGTNEGDAKLTWTAPGNNGNLGTASGYTIKYSQNPITSQTEFDNATTFPQTWTPKPHGQTENRIITGLTGGYIYYFAVEAFDNVPLYGGISNGPVSAMAADKTPPYVTGHSPAPGSTTGISTDVYVEVKDNGAGVDQSSIRMTVEGAPVTPGIVSIAGGYSLNYNPAENFAYGQEVNVTVYAEDMANPKNRMPSPHSYSFLIIANTSPTATDLNITPLEPKTGDNLVGSYTYSDVEGDPESGSEIRWYKNGNLQSAYNNTLTVPSSATAKGQAWHFTVRPKDGYSFGTLQTSPGVTIGNTAPAASNPDISPSSPLTDDDLTGDYSYSDADNDLENSSEIRWYKNGNLQSNDTLTVPSSATAKGEIWHFTVRPKDGTDYGTLQTSPSVTIGNTKPTASNPAIEPSSPLTDDDLTAVYVYSDADGDLEAGTTIRWYRNDSMQSAYNDQKVLPSSATTRGQQWRFTVRPGDGTELGTYQTSPTVTIGNTAPAASNLSISPPSPLTDDNLVGSYIYTDADSNPESGSEIRWYRNSVLQSAYNDQKVVPSSATSKGQIWHFTIRPKDGTDYGTLQTSPTVIIGNTLPVAISLSIAPSSPLTDDNLVGSYTYTDADGDLESGSEVRWYRNGELQPGYNNTLTVPSSATASSQAWHFTVRPKDGTDYGTLQTSPSVTIGNASPTATDLNITPLEPKTGDNLVGSYTYTDAEGDPESGSEVRWYKNGNLQSAYNNTLTVPSSATAKGQAWHFTVRPKDGFSFGTLQTSPSVTISNTAPVASELRITPADPKAGDSLTGDYVYNDVDGDPEAGSEVRWYKNGELQPLYNDQKMVPSTTILKGQTWYFTVRPRDGFSFGALYISGSTTIGNTAPEAVDLRITPAEPKVSDDLVGSYMYTDADGDPESGSEIRWYRDDSLQTAYNDQKVVPSSATARGQVWHFTVRPKDGTDYGTLQTSPSVTIGNASPTATDLNITPLEPKTGDNLVGSYTYSDVEGDPESGSEVRWYKDGNLQSAYNDTLTAPSSATAKGQIWHFTVRPKDGFSFGTLKISPGVNIGNTAPVVIALRITPVDPKTGDDLVLGYTYTDADGDTESGSEVRCYRDSELQPLYNDQNVVSSSATAKGEIWHFTIRPKDGTDYGTLQTSPSVTIGNTKPTASNPVIEPSSPLTDDDLTAVYVYSDADGDLEAGTTIRWYRNDSIQSAYNDQKVVPSSATTRGQQWRFTVRPGDGTELGTYQTSPTVTIGNTAPVASAGEIYEGEPGEAVAFDGSNSHDADGDPLTYSWDFGDGGTAIGVAPSHIYPDMGVYIVSLVVNDGMVDSSPSTVVVYIGTDPSMVQQVAFGLLPGWNLISIRAQPIDDDTDSVLSSIQDKYDEAWTYDATTGEWLRYIAGELPSLNNLLKIKSEAGYWIKMNQSGILVVQGLQLSRAILLKPGLNMVGCSLQTQKAVEECMASISGKYNSISTYDPDQKKWLWYIPNGPTFMNSIEFIYPGKGYIIDAKEECLWDIEP